MVLLLKKKCSARIMNALRLSLFYLITQKGKINIIKNNTLIVLPPNVHSSFQEWIVDLFGGESKA